MQTGNWIGAYNVVLGYTDGLLCLQREMSLSLNNQMELQIKSGYNLSQAISRWLAFLYTAGQSTILAETWMQRRTVRFMVRCLHGVFAFGQLSHVKCVLTCLTNRFSSRKRREKNLPFKVFGRTTDKLHKVLGTCKIANVSQEQQHEQKSKWTPEFSNPPITESFSALSAPTVMIPAPVLLTGSQRKLWNCSIGGAGEMMETGFRRRPATRRTSWS